MFACVAKANIKQALLDGHRPFHSQEWPLPNSPRVYGSPRADTVECFEHAVEKLTPALEKVEATTKREDVESKPTNHVEDGKPKTRASKLEYKLVDEVYVPCFMVTIVLTSPVKLGYWYIQVQDRGFGRGATNSDGPR